MTKAGHKEERIERQVTLTCGGSNQESAYHWEVWREGDRTLDGSVAWCGRWCLCGKALRCALGSVDLATVFEFQWTGKKLRWERLGMNMHFSGEILAWSPGHLQGSWIYPVTANTLHFNSCTAFFLSSSLQHKPWFTKTDAQNKTRHQVCTDTPDGGNSRSVIPAILESAYLLFE